MRLPALIPALLAAFLAPDLAAASAAAEIGSAGSSAAASAVRMLGALCVVFAVLFGAAWAFRNWRGFNPGRGSDRKLQVLEGRTVAPRQSVHVIGYGRQRFLIGSTPEGMNLLSHLPEGDEPAAAESGKIVPVPFTEALMQAFGRR